MGRDRRRGALRVTNPKFDRGQIGARKAGIPYHYPIGAVLRLARELTGITE